MNGFLLVDVEGVFPIQWAKEIEGLSQTLLQLNSSVVLIPSAHADPSLLRWMDDQGFRFVTDATPTRTEQWRCLRRPPVVRFWTNDDFTTESLLVRAAEPMQDVLEDALALWQLIAIDRPAIPLADDSTLDMHLSLTSSVALGTIAWDVWKEREQTAPHLVLERFADFNARVDYSRDRVTVSLPLGKRFLDLQSHGLLDEVHDVPWFDGRTLVFMSA